MTARRSLGIIAAFLVTWWAVEDWLLAADEDSILALIPAALAGALVYQLTEGGSIRKNLAVIAVAAVKLTLLTTWCFLVLAAFYAAGC